MFQSLKALTWRNLGVFRNQMKLEAAQNTITFWERYVLGEQFQARGGFEIQNILTVAKIAVRSALLRKESRGAHQRTDYPPPAPPAFPAFPAFPARRRKSTPAYRGIKGVILKTALA